MLKIKIGRANTNDYVVDNPKICKYHAELTKTAEGILRIEDMDTVNGIYVNGIRIKRKNIALEDTVILAGCYTLDIRKTLRFCNDYSDEFLCLKDVYTDYILRKKRIIKNGQLKTGLYRMLPISIGGLGVVVIGQITDDQTIRIFGSLIAISFPIFGVIWATHCQTKIPENLEELNKHFRNAFICPKCGAYLGNQDWESLVRQKECKVSGCKAIWIINSAGN